MPIDPAIAILLGIQSAAQIAHSVRYVPYFNGRLSRTFSKGVAYVGAGHMITAGNGLFTTSEATSIVAGYSYTGLRRWSVGANTQYTRSKALSLTSGHYNGETAQITASRQIMRSMHLIMSYSLRQYQSGSFSAYNRTVHYVSLGLGFAPGDVPLRVL